MSFGVIMRKGFVIFRIWIKKSFFLDLDEITFELSWRFWLLCVYSAHWNFNNWNLVVFDCVLFLFSCFIFGCFIFILFLFLCLWLIVYAAYNACFVQFSEWYSPSNARMVTNWNQKLDVYSNLVANDFYKFRNQLLLP